MLEDHRYFSKGLTRLLKTAIVAAVLSGCSMSTYENKEWFEADNRSFFESLKKHPKHERDDKTITDLIRDAHESHVNEIDPETDNKVGLTARTPSVEAVQPFKIEPSALSRVNVDTSSAACRYLRKSADTEAVIVGSPTLSASSDEDGSGSVSVGMNLLDFRKSELIRASGDAKCRLHEASKKIEATLGLGVEATRFANAWAKQSYIRTRLSKLADIERTAQIHVGEGTLTQQDSNTITSQVQQLKAEMEKSKAEASQRQDLPGIAPGDIRSRHGALVEATNDLQNIEREIRTNDALELSVSAGYRYNDEFNSNLQRSDTAGGFARVSVGVRLGALTTRRNRLEEEAAGARLDALFEENSGTIWKSGFSDRAVSRMMADLSESERELTRALTGTKSTIKKIGEPDRPEVLRAKLLAQVAEVRIGAERAGVQAALKQLQRNRNNIRALSQ
ncbi:MAG: hypothetical protein QNJ29_02000 [Rhizobiaceae bacterium]|nr:hypothetical protein [Rhizobiaceae bacterium]